MFSILSDFFRKKNIDTVAPIPLEACKIIRPYLLERTGIQDGTVFIIAIPYFTSACQNPNRNISAYAVSRNYHDYFQGLLNEAIQYLQERFPDNKFVGFADHSPIQEIEAAARAGLGVIGKNHLLLTPKYSSYVFLGEIITNAMIPCNAGEMESCENCGACTAKCPAANYGVCLSALTQKKGELKPQEQELLRQYATAWGCDICQEVCPHTKRAIQENTIFTKIPFFYQNPTPILSTELLEKMTDEEFQSRAYSWRGKATILRNLQILENKQ